jgi:hypothetical protein
VVDVTPVVDRQDARRGRRRQRSARENLIDLFGGLDNFTELTSQFAQAFLTEAEQMAPVQAAVAKAMADLGLAGITTKDQFKQTVLGLDLTTEAGQQMYAQLLTIAPAFAKVQDYLAKLNPARSRTRPRPPSSSPRSRSSGGRLEIQLMEATGRSAGRWRRSGPTRSPRRREQPRRCRSRSTPRRTRPTPKALADAEAEAARGDEAEAVASERRGWRSG